ncbi:MAG TPA: efflux RND transporter periplasmic adaptor subunit [Planctomycetota bacterium]|nr:efflux RND transporter periplasmic adaptor subunit [Planctomycetota bacterium]
MRVPELSRFVTLAAALVLVVGCGAPAKPTGGKPKKGDLRYPVQVEAVSERAVNFSIAAVGSVAAFETVAVTARVAGAVEKVSFQEGETATPDRILVEIEPERYRLAVTSAKAVLARMQAAVTDADGSLTRREAVNRDNPGLVRDEDLQNARAKSASARADQEEAKAALAIAELNLRDALVRSPIDGVLQTREVATGQYVQPGTRLATVVRRDPLLLRFRVPEGDAAALRDGLTLTFTTTDGGPFTAITSLVAGTADPVSRLVEVTARITEGDAKSATGHLRPGAFAQVTIPVGDPQRFPVIPLTAVRPSELGFVAFLAEKRDDREVAVRKVLTLGLRTADRQVAVRAGLSVGERLIVRGAEALEDGSLLRVVDSDEPAVKPGLPPPGTITPASTAVANP